MSETIVSPAHTFVHGSPVLPAVSVDSYNLEIRDEEGFVGDRASGRAFRAVLDELRAKVAELDEDPLGEVETKKLKKKQLDKILLEGEPVAAGVVQGAIEEFAGKLAGVARRYLRLKAWREVERIVVGGGLRHSRVGELAIGRAAVLLKEERIGVDMQPLRSHPDHAGLVGCVQLAPTGLLHGFDSFIAIDVGGSNVRCGIVVLHADNAHDLAKAEVEHFELWRYSEDKPSRDALIKGIGGMLRKIVAAAGKDRLQLAPFLGVGCPGAIEPDGTISAGTQNLPGNWESSKFNLPHELIQLLPKVGEHQTAVVMHNDAVVQGLSEVPAMADVKHWGVLTIGTGLGNASFTNTATRKARKGKGSQNNHRG